MKEVYVILARTSPMDFPMMPTSMEYKKYDDAMDEVKRFIESSPTYLYSIEKLFKVE